MIIGAGKTVENKVAHTVKNQTAFIRFFLLHQMRMRSDHEVGSMIHRKMCQFHLAIAG